MTMGTISTKPGEPPKVALPKCPTPFEGINVFTCIMPCPTEKGYERRMTAQGPRCVYKDDPRYSIPLNTVPSVVFDGTTLNDLQSKNVQAHGTFLKERDRFVAEFAVVDGKISKDKKLQDAFQRLQDAENVRDKSPEAYQQARSTYYMLKEGEKWLDTERERLAKAEIDPLVRQMQQTKQTTIRQLETQKRTIDVVNGLKDKVLSLKDAMKYSADTFTDQLHKVQDAINRDRRGRDKPASTSLWDWLDTVLNILIVGSLLYVLYKAAGVYMRMSRPRPIVLVPQRVGVV